MNFSLFICLLVCCVSFSQEPVSNPTFGKINKLTAYSISFSFRKTNPSHYYLVLMSCETPANEEVPKDKVIYQVGDNIGHFKVVSCGVDTVIVPRGIRANSTYYFKVYTFTGLNGNENYRQQNPLFFSVVTPGLSYVSSYDILQPNAPDFLLSLSELIAPHKVILYTNYKATLMNEFEIQDTMNGKSFVQCAYTGEKKIFQLPFDWNTTGFSREHTYPHSWMPTNPADNPPLPEYSDLHNLYPTNLDKANTVRNNYPLGEITGAVLYGYLEGRLGYNGIQIVYEPRDKHKGNAARAMMYMAVAYNGISSNNWKFPSFQEQEVLKKWHFQDLPDNYEIARQEYIYAIQGNRNPFIDHPEYVCYIDFSKMVKIKGKCSNTVYEKDSTQLVIQFQNQSCIITSEEIISDVIVYDITGKAICHYSPLGFHFQMDNSFWKEGVYFLEITLKEGEVVRKRIVLD
jgi:hypothetical protein